MLEPAPNGGRVNQGYDGDTPQAQTSAATQTLQVLNPAQFGKYEVGEQVPINIASNNLGQTQAVLLINAGGGAIDTTTQGNWQAGCRPDRPARPFTNTAVDHRPEQRADRAVRHRRRGQRRPRAPR